MIQSKHQDRDSKSDSKSDDHRDDGERPARDSVELDPEMIRWIEMATD
jgi:hypothetical protein